MTPHPDEINRLRRELMEREIEIALLKEATDAVNSQLDLETVMQNIADRARVLLNARTLLIPVLKENREEYTYIAGSGENVDEIIGQSLPREFGICGWVWKHRRPWWRGVLEELDETERTRWEKEAESVILVPLVGKKHFLGGLAGINKIDGEQFDERDLKLLTIFAAQVSIAIENAMAFHELQQAKQDAENYQLELKQLNQTLTHTNHQLEQLALYDKLTGLPNRNLVKDRLQQEIKVAQRDNSELALLLIDLDNFKDLNDTLGHDAGDVLLQEVAQRFRDTLRKCDTIGRMGGDEFAIVLPGIETLGAEQVACKLLQALEKPFVLQGNHYFISASMGITLCPKNGTDISTLLKRTDVAMYQAKVENEGFALYDPTHDEHSRSRLAQTAALRKACQEERFEFYYQPKLDAHSGKVIGAEALARWSDPVHGMVPPDVFIPILEKSGLIKAFTQILLRESLNQCKRWHQAGLKLGLAVNLSMHNLHDPKLPDQVATELRQHKLPRKTLTLEITESVAMGDPRRLPQILAQLVISGVELSIDDFGTGYSSLSYLKKLPLSELKIDKSFVMDMDRDQDNEVIVRSTVDLAHNLGLRVVAEGVENPTILNRLQQIGADILQGYEISRPLPADQFIEFVKQHNQLQPASTLIKVSSTQGRVTR